MQGLIGGLSWNPSTLLPQNASFYSRDPVGALHGSYEIYSQDLNASELPSPYLRLYSPQYAIYMHSPKTINTGNFYCGGNLSVSGMGYITGIYTTDIKSLPGTYTHSESFYGTTKLWLHDPSNNPAAFIRLHFDGNTNLLYVSLNDGALIQIN